MVTCWLEKLSKPGSNPMSRIFEILILCKSHFQHHSAYLKDLNEFSKAVWNSPTCIWPLWWITTPRIEGLYSWYYFRYNLFIVYIYIYFILIYNINRYSIIEFKMLKKIVVSIHSLFCCIIIIKLIVMP